MGGQLLQVVLQRRAPLFDEVLVCAVPLHGVLLGAGGNEVAAVRQFQQVRQRLRRQGEGNPSDPHRGQETWEI